METIIQLGFAALSFNRYWKIMANLTQFSSNLVLQTESKWHSKRDFTKLLGDFEWNAYTPAKKFHIFAYQFLTLDGELMGTRSLERELCKACTEYLKNRKADREGHLADVVACDMFCFAIYSHLHKRRESQTDLIRLIPSNLQNGRGEFFLSIGNIHIR